MGGEVTGGNDDKGFAKTKEELIERIPELKLQEERKRRARKLMDQRLQLLRRRGGGGLNDVSQDQQAPQIGQQQLLG